MLLGELMKTIYGKNNVGAEALHRRELDIMERMGFDRIKALNDAQELFNALFKEGGHGR